MMVHGASFSFSIPLGLGSKEGPRTLTAIESCCEKAGDEESVMTGRLLVSIVDDDESVRESLPDLAQEFGFAVEAFFVGGRVPGF